MLFCLKIKNINEPLRAGISKFSILLRVTMRANSSSRTFNLNKDRPRMICHKIKREGDSEDE